MKTYVVGNSLEYANWLLNSQLTNSLEEADLVLFTGGEDVYPGLYNEPVGKNTYYNIDRDKKEQNIFYEAHALRKKMLGICRGSQFLCTMAGGRLVQHQENRHGIHPIYVNDGEKILITSTHHQAQFPYEMDSEHFKLLGWSIDESRIHLDGTGKEMGGKGFKEAEIVYYPKIQALGIQGHPEYIWDGKPEAGFERTFEVLHEMINKFLNNKL